MTLHLCLQTVSVKVQEHRVRSSGPMYSGASEVGHDLPTRRLVYVNSLALGL